MCPENTLLVHLIVDLMAVTGCVENSAEKNVLPLYKAEIYFRLNLLKNLGSEENVTYEFVLAFPVLSCMSCSSYLDEFRDGKKVAVQLFFRGVLLPRFVQYSS